MLRGRSDDNERKLTGVKQLAPPPQQQQQQQQLRRQQQRDTPGRRRPSSARRRAVWHRLIHSIITGLHGIINDRFKIKIYCDWANHYLDKSNSNRFIVDLQTDLVDGVLLADVILAVTNNVVNGINRSPTGPQQMTENVTKCFDLLDQLGIDVQDIEIDDIRQGHVKTILQLFFSLSRYKQQQKITAAATTAGVSKSTAMQASDCPSRHHVGHRIDGDDFNDVDDRGLSTSLEGHSYSDHSDDVDGLYERPTGAILTQCEDMSLGLELATSTTASHGPSTSTTALGYQTVCMDVMNGNVESTQSRLPTKRSSIKQSVSNQRRLPMYSSSAPTSTKLSVSATSQRDNQVAPSTNNDDSITNNNFDVNAEVNSNGHQTVEEDELPDESNMTHPSSTQIRAEMAIGSLAAGGTKPNNVVNGNAAKLTSSVEGSVCSESTGVELSTASSVPAATSITTSATGRRSRSVLCGFGGSTRKSGTHTTVAASSPMARSVPPLVVDDEDVSAANRMSIYDNVETPSCMSSSVSAVRRRPTAAISRLAVSATNLIGMLGGGAPAGCESTMLTCSGAIPRGSGGNRLAGSTTLAASCDNVATCSFSTDASTSYVTSATSHLSTVGSRKPASKTTTPTSSIGRSKSARGGLIRSRRPASDGGIPASTNLPVKSPGSTVAIGVVAVTESDSSVVSNAPKQKTPAAAAKQRTMTLPIRSTSLSLGLHSPTSMKASPCCPVTSNGLKGSVRAGPLSPTLTPTSQPSPSRFQFGVKPKSATITGSTPAATPEQSKSFLASTGEAKSRRVIDDDKHGTEILNSNEPATDKDKAAAMPCTGIEDVTPNNDEYNSNSTTHRRPAAPASSPKRNTESGKMEASTFPEFQAPLPYIEHEERFERRLEEECFESDDSGEYRRMDSDDDIKFDDDVENVSVVDRCGALQSRARRADSSLCGAEPAASSSEEFSEIKSMQSATKADSCPRRPPETHGVGNQTTNSSSGSASNIAEIESGLQNIDGEDCVMKRPLNNIDDRKDHSTTDIVTTPTGSGSSFCEFSATVDAKMVSATGNVDECSSTISGEGAKEIKNLGENRPVSPPMDDSSSSVWLRVERESRQQDSSPCSTINGSSDGATPREHLDENENVPGSTLPSVASTLHQDSVVEQAGLPRHHNNIDTSTQQNNGGSLLPAVTRVTPKSYGSRKLSRDVIVRPMRSIRESPEMGSSSMSPVERSFLDNKDDANSRSYSSPGHCGDCSSPSNASTDDKTVHLTAVARSMSDGDSSTKQPSNSATSPVPDFHRPANNGPCHLARPTGLIRSTSERTSRPSHQPGVNQSGMSRSVHVVSSPSARRTQDSMTSGRVLSPLSHQPHLTTTTTTTSNDVPWWWTAAEKTVAANAGRSSTLPRTIRDSVEPTSHPMAPGGAVMRGAAVGGNNAVDRADKCMDRRRISMGSESYRQMALSPTAQLTSRMPSAGTGSVRSANVAAKEETPRESSALTVISMDVNGRCKNDKYKSVHQTTSTSTTTRQHLVVPAAPSTTASSTMASSSMPVLTPRQLCADAERLSNYRKLSEDPNIKFRHNGSPYQRDATMTSSKSTELAISASPSPAPSADVSSVGVSAPSKRFRERWLASDGSSTENVPALCVEATKEVGTGREAIKNASKTNGTTTVKSSDRSSSAKLDAERRQQCDVQTPRQSRRELEVTRSAELLPAAANATSGRQVPDSTSARDASVTRGLDALSASFISTQSRSRVGSNGSSLSGNGYEVFDDDNDDLDGGHPAWLQDCTRHRNDVSRSDSCGGDHRKFVPIVGGPGASNSVPRGMALCAAKSSPITGLAAMAPTYNYQTAYDMAALGGAMTSSATAGLCITCSGPSPKRLLSSRDDDWRGSVLSLISNSSSVYSTNEEKQAQEVRKLKRDLEMAQEKINTLTTQLSTNVHVVTAFEKSLSNMTQRLQKLASSSEQKDTELNQLKAILRSLRDKSKRHLDGDGSPGTARHPVLSKQMSIADPAAYDKQATIEALLLAGLYDGIGYHSDSMASLVTGNVTNDNGDHTKRPQSSSSQGGGASNGDNKKLSKINWLKMSLTKAFQRSRRRGGRSKKSKTSSGRTPGGAWSDTESEAAASSVRSAAEVAALSAALSMPNSPNVGPRQHHPHRHPSSDSVPHSTPATPSINEVRRLTKSPQQQQPQLPVSTKGATISTPARGSSSIHPSMYSSTTAASSGQSLSQSMPPELIVLRLQQQLREKDLKLTDVRLEALSSAHQLDSLRDAMNRMKNEIASLKSENERMQRAITDRGPDDQGDVRHGHGSSTMSTSLTTPEIDRRSTSPKRISLGDPTRFDALAIDSLHKNAHRITVSVQRAYMGGDMVVSQHRHEQGEANMILIGAISLNSSTNWESLDDTIRRLFKKHVRRLDPAHGLGLGGSSILLYRVGEIVRNQGSKLPDLLPCGYLVGDSNSIVITLKGPRECCVDALAFETLIPKSVVQRYVALLVEHRRVIICGPTGTGKTYLARRLAETLVLMSSRELNDLGVVSTFNLDQKSGRELRQYLASVADQCLASGRGVQDIISTTTTTTMTTTPLDSLEPALDGRGVASLPVETGSGDGMDRESVRQQTRTGELMPVVVVLDNLQHVGPAPTLADSFQALLGVQHQACPYIIGTLVQTKASSSTGSPYTVAPAATHQTAASNNLLQMHHNFRWIIYSNHVEPVAGFLARYLQRRLVSDEIRWTTSGFAHDAVMTDGRSGSLGRRRHYEAHSSSPGGSTDLMMRVIDWLPRMWQHVNRFIESRCGVGSDVTIGPRLFMTCPMDYQAAHQWFIDLWNYSIIPYLIEAFRDGPATHLRGSVQNPRQQQHQQQQQMSSSTSGSSAGRQTQRWQDPTDWVMANFPWALPLSGASATAVSESLSSSADSSCSSGLGGGRPLSLLRLRPEDLGFVDGSLANHGGSERDDVGPDFVDDATSGWQRVATEWDDQSADGLRRAGCPAGTTTTKTMDDIRQTRHDGSGDDDGTMWQQSASIAFDPLTNMLLRLQEAAGSTSPVPSIDDWSSDTSTGSGSTATGTSSHRVQFRRRRAGDRPSIAGHSNESSTTRSPSAS